MLTIIFRRLTNIRIPRVPFVLNLLKRGVSIFCEILHVVLYQNCMRRNREEGCIFLEFLLVAVIKEISRLFLNINPTLRITNSSIHQPPIMKHINSPSSITGGQPRISSDIIKINLALSFVSCSTVRLIIISNQ